MLWAKSAYAWAWHRRRQNVCVWVRARCDANARIHARVSFIYSFTVWLACARRAFVRLRASPDTTWFYFKLSALTTCNVRERACKKRREKRTLSRVCVWMLGKKAKCTTENRKSYSKYYSACISKWALSIPFWMNSRKAKRVPCSIGIAAAAAATTAALAAIQIHTHSISNY